MTAEFSQWRREERGLSGTFKQSLPLLSQEETGALMARRGLVVEGGEGGCCWWPRFPRSAGEVMVSADLMQQHVEGPKILEAAAVL